MPTQPYTRELQRMGVEVVYGVDPTRGADAHLAEPVARDLSAAPRSPLAGSGLIREHGAGAQIVYDTVDLHWLREARQAAAATGAKSVDAWRRRASRPCASSSWA